MRYSQLTGICAKAIKQNLCSGCNLLENENFRGKEKCEYVTTAEKAIDFCKNILKERKEDGR